MGGEVSREMGILGGSSPGSDSKALWSRMKDAQGMYYFLSMLTPRGGPGEILPQFFDLKPARIPDRYLRVISLDHWAMNPQANDATRLCIYSEDLIVQNQQSI